MTSILAIFTCFNRKEKTEKCIRSIVSSNLNCLFDFIVVDDNSNDGTQEMLKQLSNEYSIHLIESSGNSFYSGGMKLGMDFALNNNLKFDYLLIMNDDVEFIPKSIEKMIEQSRAKNKAVIVGAMKDHNGNLSYGAIKYTKNIKYKKMAICESNEEADTFNANCVLIPYNAFVSVGSMDSHYIHSLGDFDYGLEIKKNGFKLYSSNDYVGICDNNSAKGTWMDNSLSRKERIIKKESIKGAPTKQWFYFLKKHFGILVAIRGAITPYIRILIGR